MTPPTTSGCLTGDVPQDCAARLGLTEETDEMVEQAAVALMREHLGGVWDNPPPETWAAFVADARLALTAAFDTDTTELQRRHGRAD